MRSSWAQPSLSRDFALLAVAILFVLLLISGWVTYVTYTRHTERVTTELEKEAARIERTLATEMNNANYMLSALGRQIVLDPNRDYVKLAQVLKSFDSKGYIYSIFSWVSADQHVVVSSNRGVLEGPVDISDRDYVQKAEIDPWKMHIGRPIEGRVSGRWVIPVAMGVTDYTGKFIGTIMISIDINTLTDQISNLVKRDGISFAVVSKALVPLTQVSDNPNFVSDNFPTQQLANIDFAQNPYGLVEKGNLFWGDGNYSYYRVSEPYPYLIMLSYDANLSDETVRTMLWSRLLQLMGMAVFFVLFLWIVRVRIIKPVLDMTTIIASVASGRRFTPLPKVGAVEIEALGAQVQHVSEYISENKRIEEELRNKMFMLKKAKESAELDRRSKSEFMAYLSQEMRVPLNNIIGFAQVLKDQMYGPIENRKYRQYAADIFQTANQLIEKMQDVLVHAKIETGYVKLQEKPLEVATIINAALRQLTDKLQADKTVIKVTIQEPLPRLIADEFRLQQVLMNILLFVIESQEIDENVEKNIALDVRVVNENRDKQFLVFSIYADGNMVITQDVLRSIMEKAFLRSEGSNKQIDADSHTDLRLELARLLIGLHGGMLYNEPFAQKNGGLFVLFPALRLDFQDGSEL